MTTSTRRERHLWVVGLLAAVWEVSGALIAIDLMSQPQPPPPVVIGLPVVFGLAVFFLRSTRGALAVVGSVGLLLGAIYGLGTLARATSFMQFGGPVPSPSIARIVGDIGFLGASVAAIALARWARPKVLA